MMAFGRNIQKYSKACMLQLLCRFACYHVIVSQAAYRKKRVRVSSGNRGCLQKSRF